MENSQVNENKVLNEKKQTFPEILNIPKWINFKQQTLYI